MSTAANTIYRGRPDPRAGAVALGARLPSDTGRWIDLEVRVLGADAGQPLDPGLALRITLDGAEVAALPLSELAGRRYDISGWQLRRQGGVPVSLEFADPNGAWAAGAPLLEVVLTWFDISRRWLCGTASIEIALEESKRYGNFPGERRKCRLVERIARLLRRSVR